MNLVDKYNIAGPRYTSYPTVPFWQNEIFSESKWKEQLKKNSKKGDPISVYIHLPFCESLCTFCACHKRITKNHTLENPYITALLKEWEMYVEILGSRPIISELHLGGGTPSFFSSENLDVLMQGIFKRAEKAPKIDFSWEGHPNNTTYEHLEVLAKNGFRRVSFGVQDYDATVQKAIHRLQPYENVKKVTDDARKIGYKGVSHDLVFGLPFQTLTSMEFTIKKTLELNPDRIAFYSYAHVPWIKGNGQRGFEEKDLPDGVEKRALYDFGRKLLEENGYFEVGMDHFAKKSDPLFIAMSEGKLHRNFMGYTIQKTSVLIGLGASAISDAGTGYAQNAKGIEEYQRTVEEGKLPVVKGHILSEQDVFIKEQILNIMCRFYTTWKYNDWESETLFAILLKLKEFEKDGLLEVHSHGLKVTSLGIPFVRNISMVFDQYLTENTVSTNLFSKTV